MRVKPKASEYSEEVSGHGAGKPPRPPTEEELRQSEGVEGTRKLHLKEKEVRDLKNQKADRVLNPIEVEEILSENLEKEQGFEREIELGPVLSRRGRDFLLLVVLGNLGLILTAILLPANSIFGVALLSGFVLYNLGLWWVLYVVMDRY
ncbi:MAG: hypothetical protein JJT75_12130 [Opitutales bacterium]|nr:hypothetical protein [Opitutales bacterium]MCH8540230.1 hypothetical protein [Opitutales bacterium]